MANSDLPETKVDESTADSLIDGMREMLLPFARWLHDLLEPLDTFLASLSTEVGRYCSVALFIIAAILVWALHKDSVYRGAPDLRPWRDLRVWTVVFLLPYLVIYLFFF